MFQGYISYYIICTLYCVLIRPSQVSCHHHFPPPPYPLLPPPTPLHLDFFCGIPVQVTCPFFHWIGFLDLEEFFTYSWQYLLQIPPPTGWPALPHFPTLGSQGGLSNGNTPPPPHRPTRSLWGPARQEKVMGGCTGKGWVCPGGGVAERVNRIGIHPGELKGAGPRQHLGPGQEGPTVAEAGTRAQGPGSEPGFGARLPELLCLWLRPVQGTPGPGTQWALNRPCCPVLSIREEVKGENKPEHACGPPLACSKAGPRFLSRPSRWA